MFKLISKKFLSLFLFCMVSILMSFLIIDVFTKDDNTSSLLNSNEINMIDEIDNNENLENSTNENDILNNIPNEYPTAEIVSTQPGVSGGISYPENISNTSSNIDYEVDYKYEINTSDQQSNALQGVTPLSTGPYYTLYSYYSDDRQNFSTNGGGLVRFAESTSTDQFGNPTDFIYFSWYQTAGYYGNYPYYFKLCAQPDNDYKFYGFWECGHIESNGKPSGIDKEVPKDYRESGPKVWNERGSQGTSYYAVFIHKDAPYGQQPPDPGGSGDGHLVFTMDNGIDHISVSVDYGPFYDYYGYYSGHFGDGQSLRVRIYSKFDDGYILDGANSSGYYDAWYWDAWDYHYNIYDGYSGYPTLYTTAWSWVDGCISLYSTSFKAFVQYFPAYLNSPDNIAYPRGGTVSSNPALDDDSWVRMCHRTERITLYAKPLASYGFLGWYKSTSPGREFPSLWKSVNDSSVYMSNVLGSDTYTTESDYKTTLHLFYFAVFAIKYKVTITADEGVNVAGGTGQFTYTAGQLLNLPSSYTSIFNVTISDGFSWGGWELKFGGLPKEFSMNSITQSSTLVMPTVNFHLHAKAINLTKFGLNIIAASSTDTGIFVYDGLVSPGGSVKFSTDVNYGASSVQFTDVGIALSMQANANSGYKFIGWYKSMNPNNEFYYDDLYSTSAAVNSEPMVTGSPGEIVLKYYAVFCKFYNFTNRSISGNGITDTTPSGSYYYTQPMHLFINMNDAYDFNGWTVVSGSPPANFSHRISSQDLRMPANHFEIMANTSKKIYTIKVFSFYQDNNGNLSNSTTGGSVRINNENYTAYIQMQFEHGTQISLSARLNFNEESIYGLKGWFKSLTGNEYSNPLFSYMPPQPSEWIWGYTYVNENLTITESLNIYAIITNCYKCRIDYDEGISSTSISGEKFYFSNDELQVSAVVKNGYIWDGWWGKTSINGEEILLTNNETLTKKITSPLYLTARTKVLNQLTVHEMTENTNGIYNKSTEGGSFTGSGYHHSSSKLLIEFITITDGFQFDGFFTNEGLTASYTRTTVPNDKLELYAKFSRIFYDVNIAVSHTDQTDNIHFSSINYGSGLISSMGGTFEASRQVKFGCTTTLKATANEGFVLYGIYTSYNSYMHISGNAPWKTGADCDLTGNVYKTLSKSMTQTGQIYHAIFKRLVSTVTLDKGEGTELSINGLIDEGAFYGQTLTFSASALNGYNSASVQVQVYKTGTSQILSSTQTSCEMPAFPITIKSTATPNLYTIRYNPNGGSFSSTNYPQTINFDGTISGTATFNSTNYTHSSSISSSGYISSSGAPNLERIGYELLSWNDQSDGSGENYIIYSIGGTTYTKWDKITNDVTLYAIWEAMNPVLTFTQLKNEFTYNGNYNDVLRVDIQNYVAGRTYLYEWIENGIVIKSEEGTFSSHVLKLRSLNASGSFSICCKVTDDANLSTQTASKTVKINKRELIIELGEREIVDAFKLYLSNSDLSGLSDNHSIQEGSYLMFNCGQDEIIYSNENKELIIQHIELLTIDVEQGNIIVSEQDGKRLIDNYDIKFTGSVKIKNPQEYTKLIVGGYERTVNEATFEDNFISTTLNGLEFSIAYENEFESDLIINLNGTQTRYILWENEPRNLSVTFSKIPSDYKIYKILVENFDISEYTVTENGTLKIEMSLLEEMRMEDEDNNSFINLKIYFTNQALVTYIYGFESVEIDPDYVNFDGVDKRVLTNGKTYSTSANAQSPTRKGFRFDGWFYDEAKTMQVGITWFGVGALTIYAKWTLIGLTMDDVEIKAKDNSGNEISEPFTREYNGNLIILFYEIEPTKENPAITYKATWLWRNPLDNLYYSTNNVNFKNVTDSGNYSVMVEVNYGGVAKSMVCDPNSFHRTVTITPRNITLTLQISKTYDGTTSLGTYYIDGIEGEQLKLVGSYSTPNVNLVNGIASPVGLDGLGIQGYNGSNATNYNLVNTEYSGVINQYHYEIDVVAEKDYDNNIFSEMFSHEIYFSSGIQTINFTIETESEDCGLYKSSLESPWQLFVRDDFSVTNSPGSIEDNYKLSVKETASVRILKISLNNIVFNDKIKYYSGNTQMIFLEDLNGNSYENNLPTGATSIEYFYNGNSTNGFINAGIYTIDAVVTGDNNHTNSSYSAKLTIKKADISFAFYCDNELLSSSYEYTGNDLYGSLKIVATNESGTDIVPDLSFLIKRNGASVSSVIDAGVYEIEAIFDKQNFNAVSDYIKEFIIKAMHFIVGEHIKFNPTTIIYAGENVVDDDLINNNLILPETLPENGIFFETYSILMNGHSQQEAKNVGSYILRIKLKSSDETKWTIDQNYIDGELQIIPFVLGNENFEVYNSEKVYDGTNSLPSNIYLSITLNTGVVECIGIDGNYASINVNNNIAFENISLKNYQNFFASDYSISDNFNLEGKISPKNLEIKLYKEYINESYNTFLQWRFNGEKASFEIGENSIYVTGTVANEYLVARFETTDSEKGMYPYQFSGSGKYTKYTNEIEVFSENGDPIVDGINNYNRIISGGIEIIEILTDIEFIGLDNPTYMGDKISFSIILTTFNIIEKTIDTEKFDYVYESNGYFKDEDDAEIDNNILSLEIYYETNQVHEIFKAGEYELKLFSENSSYIFSSTSDNILTFNFEVLKAEITFDFNVVEWTYGEPLEFSSENSFEGVGGEIFHIKLNYDSSEMNVDEYELNSIIGLENCESLNSTGDLKNYDVLIVGVLRILPKEITADNVYENLTYLTYSGANHYETLQDEINTFTFNNKSLNLAKNSDFWVDFTFNGVETKEIKSAGNYVAKISSINYKFTGGTEGSQLGDYNFCELEFKVEKRDLNILLYKDEDNNEFIKLKFCNKDLIFELNESNNQNFVDGIVSGEYITAKFMTTSNAVGIYPIDGTIDGNFTYQIDDFVVFNKDNAEIRNGANNYNISVEGGLEIVYIETEVLFKFDDKTENLTYKGAPAFVITLQLTTDYSGLNDGREEVTENFEYIYGIENNFFISAETKMNVSTDKLKLEIKFENAPIEVILNAGNYELLLISNNYYYTFESGEDNEPSEVYRKNITVGRANLTFNLENKEIPYGKEFNCEGAFDGVTRTYTIKKSDGTLEEVSYTERFYIKFNCDTSRLDVGQYDFSDLITQDNYTERDYSPEDGYEAGDFKNYNLPIIEGTLTIRPREVSVSANFPELKYNGKNQISLARAVEFTFTDKEDEGELILSIGFDYLLTFLLKENEISNETETIKDAGTYFAKLTSTNYKFIDGENSEVLGGENYILKQFSIGKTELEIRLFDVFVAENSDNNKFIQKYYKENEAVTAEINKGNSSKYTVGLVNGEYIEVSYTTSVGAGEGEHEYGEGTTQIEGFKIFDKNNVQIDYIDFFKIDGILKNYEIIGVSGGIEIIMQDTIVEFLNMGNLVYNASNHEIRIKLTQLEEGGVVLEIECCYDYDDEIFKYKNENQEEIEIDDLTLEIRFNESETSELEFKKAGNYELKLISNQSYKFKSSGDYYHIENFVIKKAEITFDFNVVEWTYGEPLEFSSENSFEGVGGEIFYIKLNYDSSEMNVDEYELNSIIGLTNYTSLSNSTGDLNNYDVMIVGVLRILPKEITADNVYKDLDLIYSGANHYETLQDEINTFTFNNTSLNLTKNSDFWVKFSSKEIINVDTYSVTLSSKNYEFEGGESADQFGGLNTITFNFKVNQKSLTVSLKSIEDNNEFIKLKFCNKDLIFELNESNNQNFVDGIVSGEYITAKFMTTSNAVGIYPIDGNFTYQIDDFVVFNRGTNTEIRNGANNYNISIEGGLEIIYIFTEVEFIELNDLTYNGVERVFKIQLSTNLTLLGESEKDETFTVVYGASGNYFVQENGEGDEVIPTDRLSVLLERDNTAVSYIKNAGNYKITIKCLNGDYIFESKENENTPSNMYISDTIIVKQADINFELEEIITYGGILNVIKEIEGGEGDDSFVLKLYSNETTSLNVGEYNIGTDVNEVKIDLSNFTYAVGNTANFENYNITIFGTLTVLARSVVASADYSSLFYNGKNQYQTIRNVLITFKDGQSNESLNLKGQYGLRYLNDKNDETTDFISAGKYKIELSSTNYEFIGGESDEDINGKYTYSYIFNIEIEKAPLEIRLYENFENLDYIRALYNGETAKFELTNENNSKYVSGMQNGERLTGEFETGDIAIGEYTNNDGSNELIIKNLTVFRSDGTTEIQNGLENYDYEILGGIKIEFNLTEIVFIGFDSDFVYSGMNLPINVILTYNDLNNQYISKLFEYNYENSRFESDGDAVLANDLSLDIFVIIDGTETKVDSLKNAGEYKLLLKSENEKYFFDEDMGTSFEQTLNIISADLKLNLGSTEIDYGNEFNITPENEFIGVNDETFYLQISYDTKQFSVVGSPYSLSSFLTVENVMYAEDENRQCSIELDEFKNNYNLVFEGELIVNPCNIIVEEKFSELSLEYDKTDKIVDIYATENIFKYDNDTEKTLYNGIDYMITCYNGNIPLLEIVDAGSYRVELSSSNYNFKDSILKNGLYCLSFDFEVHERKISVNFNVEDIYYNGENQNPVSYEWVYGDGPETAIIHGDNLGESLIYSNNQFYVRNVGEYYSVLSITNKNYLIISGAQSAVFEILPYSVELSAPNETYFEKYFGKQDPELTLNIESLNENLFILFEREPGEAVGKYALKNPTLDNDRNSSDVLNNFEIDSTNFIDEFGAFSIKALENEAGNLIIRQNENIEITYDAEEHNSVSYENFTNCFTILNHQEIKLNSGEFDLNANFIFQSGNVCNAGEYILLLNEAESLTHTGEISFDNNGQFFVISKKPVSVENASDKINKTYDRTSDVEVSDELTLKDICSSDISKVALKGVYVDESRKEMVNVGTDYLILWSLTGDAAENYIIYESDIFLGDILPRELTVLQIGDNAFDKEYDGTSIVNIGSLELENVIAGDVVGFNGFYMEDNVEVATVGTYEIVFSTTNSNYIFAQTVYEGKITQRILTVSENSNFIKQYDGKNDLDVNLIDIDSRIVGGDNVSLVSATLAGVNVGRHIITFELSGDDSNNYTVESRYGEIIEKTIQLKFHYGNEAGIYEFPFVDDGQSISNITVTEKNVLFGVRLDDVRNGLLSLPTAQRYGYEFNGWFSSVSLDSNTAIYLTTIIDETNNFILGDILENEGLDLYANWKPKEYRITVELRAESQEINEFLFSSLGGNYSILINGERIEYNNESKTFSFKYYETLNFEFSPNDNFNFAGLFKSDEQLTQEISYDYHVIETTRLTVKFSRKIYKVEINTGTVDLIGGFPSEWSYHESTGIATCSVRFGGFVNLPLLNGIGHIFAHYENLSDTIYNAGDQISPVGDITLNAIWVEKEFKVFLNYAEGTLVGNYERDTYLDDESGNYYIKILFGEEFGELPTLEKLGYVQTDWILKSGEIILSIENTENTIWEYDIAGVESYELVALWKTGENKIEFTSDLNTDLYVEKEISNYKSYDNTVLKVICFVDGENVGEDLNAFYVQTNQSVQLTAIVNSEYYIFDGWYLIDSETEAEIEIINLMNFNGVDFESIDECLIITGFKWGDNCPEIVAKYKPFDVEVEIGDYEDNYGRVEFAEEQINGIFIENSKYKSLTGSEILVEYETFKGYELISIEIENANYEQDEIQNSIKVYDFSQNIKINFEFDRKSHEFIINKTGVQEGFNSVKYSIIEENGEVEEYIEYSLPITIKTGQLILVRLEINYGYENVDWTLVGGGDLVSIIDINQSSQSLLEKQISGFVSDIEFTIELKKQTFNLSASCEIYSNGTYSSDTTENQCGVTDLDGNSITFAEYLDEVVFNAICYVSNFSHVGYNEPLATLKYDFIGWYLNYGQNNYILISTESEYIFSLKEDTNLVAVFKLKSYTVSFANEDVEGGRFITENGQADSLQFMVEFGKFLSNSVELSVVGGYSFAGWTIKYYYMNIIDGVENEIEIIKDLTDITSATFEPSDIGEVYGNINIIAKFDTLPITVKGFALFIDDTSSSETKIAISYGNQSGLEIEFNYYTQTEIEITAIAMEGYAVLYWDISGNYEFLSDSKEFCSGDYYLIKSTIRIKFTDNSSSQSITAYFERFEHQVVTSLQLDNGQILGGGIIFDSENRGHNTVLTSHVQTEDSLIIFVNISIGFHLDLESDWFSIIGFGAGNVIIESVESIALDDDLLNFYSQSFKLIISGFLYRTDISIYVERNKTEIRFYESKSESGWEFIGKTAIIEFGTNKILIDGDRSFLIPTSTTHEFLGWSNSSELLNIYILPDGTLNFDEWRNNIESINLYAKWDLLKIKLNVQVEPISATSSSNYYYDFLRNINPSSMPVLINGNYYFYVGAIFGISLPVVDEQYGFMEYLVLKPNGNGGFIWCSIKESTENLRPQYSLDLFSINSYADYLYSESNGSGTDVSGLADGTIYIKLIYGINVRVLNKNYYTRNTTMVIGGDSRINATQLSGTFLIGTEINLSATVHSGYMFKYWLVKGVQYTSLNINVTVEENLTIEAFFVGKPVEVNLLETPEGQANPVSGGNPELINGIVYYHVGDIIDLSAIPGIGYNFADKWIHAIFGEFQRSSYTIREQDGNNELVELKPVFDEKDLNVRFQIDGAKGGIELRDVDEGVRFKITIVDGKTIYSYPSKYFSEIVVQIKANAKFKYMSIEMLSNNILTNVSQFVDNNSLLSITHTAGFNNADEVLFIIDFTKTYWYEYILEEGRLIVDNETPTITRDLLGKGTVEDAYKINSIDDYALWAYVINHGIIQADINKSPYNSPSTYYEVNSQVLFNARYWTPIGTEQNPFNGIVHLYALRIGIEVDVEDANYPIELFDSEVLKLWGGLFGYLSETAEIVEVIPNYIFIILIGIGVAIIISVVILVTSTITKRRNKQFSSIDKPLFLK